MMHRGLTGPGTSTETVTGKGAQRKRERVRAGVQCDALHIRFVAFYDERLSAHPEWNPSLHAGERSPYHVLYPQLRT